MKFKKNCTKNILESFIFDRQLFCKSSEKSKKKQFFIFTKFSIFDSKFLENYKADFETETSFGFNRAKTFK